MIPYSAEFESQVVDAGKDDKEAQAAKAKELGGVSMIQSMKFVFYLFTCSLIGLSRLVTRISSSSISSPQERTK